VVLGAALANDLFVQESPVGQTIFIGEWPFLVVGVLEWVGDPVAVAPAGPDSGVFVPFRACAAAFRGNEQAAIVRLRLTSLDAGVDRAEDRCRSRRQHRFVRRRGGCGECPAGVGSRTARGDRRAPGRWCHPYDDFHGLLFSQVSAGARPHISMLTALSLLTLVGLVSGVWPAKRAAAVFPAEALRAD